MSTTTTQSSRIANDMGIFSKRIPKLLEIVYIFFSRFHFHYYLAVVNKWLYSHTSLQLITVTGFFLPLLKLLRTNAKEKIGLGGGEIWKLYPSGEVPRFVIRGC